LRSGHPRLIAVDADIERIRSSARDNTQIRKLLADLEREADKMHIASPVEHKLVGPRMLAQSLRARDRIYTLALLYRLDGKRAHFDAALRELRAAAAFKDWNPAYFVDAAEMTHACAIGYDWLYTALEEPDRVLIRDAIVQKGLLPGLQGYTAQSSWVTGRDHWNIVCNSGLALAALAIAEDEPEKSAAVVKYAIDSLQRGLALYGPDGGWAEGPAYWDDATRSTATFLAALETALGTDFGISNHPGLSRTGRFRLYFSSPTNKIFNYADAMDELTVEPAMFWLARRYGQPALAWQEQKLIDRATNAEPLDLVWYQREAKAPAPPLWPLDAVFSSVQWAFFRSSWEDPNALFLAVKGGDNKGPRAHLDLGSFVLDAGGIRWALDLGHDDVNLPGYLGKQRWSYYRTRTESHNTMLIDGENQDLRAEARIVRHEFTPDLAWAQIDLSKAYPTKVKMFQRRIGLANRQAVLIQDTVQAEQPVDVLWGMVTDAEVTVNGQTAELTKEGWTLSAEIRTPRHAVFDVASTKAPPPQAPNTGTRKLVVRVGERLTDLDLNIVLTPHKTGQPKPKITTRFPA
jgi:hypothetical protein